MPLMVFLSCTLPARTLRGEIGQFGVAGESHRHQLAWRELADARLQGRRQQFLHAKTHLQADDTVLRFQRKDARIERQDDQGRGGEHAGDGRERWRRRQVHDRQDPG